MLLSFFRAPEMNPAHSKDKMLLGMKGKETQSYVRGEASVTTLSGLGVPLHCKDAHGVKERSGREHVKAGETVRLRDFGETDI